MRLVQNSLHHEVAATLREQIFDGTLAPASFIDEVALCERLKISRTPLREALKVLSAEGLLRHEPRRGCFVSEVTEQDLDNIFPVIALLEGRCAYEAARNASAADLLALGTLHERLQAHARAGLIKEFMRPSSCWPTTGGWRMRSLICEKSSSWPACSSCMHLGDWRKAWPST